MLLDQVVVGGPAPGAFAGGDRSALRDSPLGVVLAAGLRNLKSSRYVMKEAIEEAGRGVAHELGRFLTTLGTIATAAPLLGLFGTVIGMIEIFGSQSPTGGTNPQQLAHGISIALYNTAFGIALAIPGLSSTGIRAKATASWSRWSSSRRSWTSCTESGGVNFRRGQEKEPLEINLVPMIDVMLVILIFLMITTTYSSTPSCRSTCPRRGRIDRSSGRTR